MHAHSAALQHPPAPSSCPPPPPLPARTWSRCSSQLGASPAMASSVAASSCVAAPGFSASVARRACTTHRRGGGQHESRRMAALCPARVHWQRPWLQRRLHTQPQPARSCSPGSPPAPALPSNTPHPPGPAPPRRAQSASPPPLAASVRCWVRSPQRPWTPQWPQSPPAAQTEE